MVPKDLGEDIVHTDDELDLDQIIDVSTTWSELSDLLDHTACTGARIGLERHGKVVAVLISPQDMLLFDRIEDAADVREVERRERDDDGRRIGLGELFEQLGIDPSQQVDPEMRTASSTE